MSVDQKLSRSIHEFTKRSWILRHLAVFCADDLIWLMMGFLLAVQIFGPGNLTMELLMFFLVLFIPYVFTAVLSMVFKRPRPYDKQSYAPLIHPFIETPSFPSSHATFVFALTVVAFGVSLPIPIGIVLLAACAVALGRVAVGVHYLSDVLAGALIGFTLGWLPYIGLIALRFLSHGG